SRFWQAGDVPLTEVLLVVISAALLALLARWGRAFALERRWRAPLGGVPPELARLWAERDPRVALRSSIVERSELSAIDVLFHVSRLDRRQLSRFRPERPPVDLRELLSQFRESAAVVANRPGVGEQLLAERLIHQAHDVAFEEPSAGEDGDLPGWPARVDGTRVRLLASPDPAEVQRLLDRAPALAIVTVAEHARPFAEQANVLA